MSLPDFLIIGAQKSGTTWLDRNLRLHPQLWLPPEKEMHFFDLPLWLPFCLLRFAPMRGVRHWARYRMRRDASIAREKPELVEFYRRYYWSPRTTAWYRKAFTPAEGQLSGETTPRYATLGKRRLRQLARLLPDVKIVYLLRDPIDRMWSDLALFSSAKFGGQGLGAESSPMLHAFLSDERNLAHSRYFSNLEAWRQVVPPARIHLAFYDDIPSNPERLLKDICRFLGVDSSSIRPERILRDRIHAHEYPPLSGAVATKLALRLLPDIRRLQAELPNAHTTRWLARAEALLAPPR